MKIEHVDITKAVEFTILNGSIVNGEEQTTTLKGMVVGVVDNQHNTEEDIFLNIQVLFENMNLITFKKHIDFVWNVKKRIRNENKT